MVGLYADSFSDGGWLDGELLDKVEMFLEIFEWDGVAVGLVLVGDDVIGFYEPGVGEIGPKS